MSPLLNPRPACSHDPLPATRRTGRNLPTAIGVAVALTAMILGSLTLYKVVFVGVVVLTVCRTLWELAAAFAYKRIRLSLTSSRSETPRISMCAWKMGAEAASEAYVATADVCVLWSLMGQAEAEVDTVLEQTGHDILRTRVHDETRRSHSSVAAASVFATTYLPFLAGFAVLLLVREHGMGEVITFIVLAAANGTGGWMADITFGRHPLAPLVSPRKSWEGPMGSLIAAVATGAGCIQVIGGPWWTGATLGACIVTVSTLRDLGESLFRRDLRLEDMGTLLLGHGGITNRLNSVPMVTPPVYTFVPLVKQERMPHPPLSTSPALPSPGTRETRA